MERYRSGHNEAVLKTVCPQGRVGSNPTLSAGDTSPPNILFGIKASYLNRYVLCDIYNMKNKVSLIWRSTQEAEGAPLERE